MRLTLVSAVVLLAACRTMPDSKTGVDGLSSDDGAALDGDGDGATADTDCDDGDATVGPGAVEVCDGVDNDCDGVIDEDVMPVWYVDADEDGFGDPSQTAEACEAPPGTVPNASDCDDSNGDVWPGAEEVCDGIDNDCNGDIDERLGETWYADADGDGFGDPATAVESCERPASFVADSTDCDDSEVDDYPGAEEVCDERDNNCNGAVDEGTTTTFYADLDGDGWGDNSAIIEVCSVPPGYAEQAGDCDPAEDTIYPGASEVCDGVDQDCDGVADNGVLISFYADTDTDGYGDAGVSTEACTAPTGFVVDATDCDDTVTEVNPAATEVCNELDDDCNGLIDDDDRGLDLSTAATWYGDSDSDGFGDASVSSVSCDAPTSTVADATDCDDGESTVYPGADEICDGQDNDCDGSGDPMDGSAAACPAVDCLDVLSYASTDGLYWIEPGSVGAYEVHCDLTTEGGGWTLAWVVSDDGQDTWTWSDRDLMGSDPTPFGAVSDLTADMKSDSAHEILFYDMLFVHAPSGITAEYEAVGDGTMDLGSHIDAIGDLNCDYGMAGNSHALTGGTLTLGGSMCDTDLYFNLGDHESSLATCQSFASTWNHATYGPAWSHGYNNGCPFDDPSSGGLGPSFDCPNCTSGTESSEAAALGFASTLGLNTGTGSTGANTMRVYVR